MTAQIPILGRITLMSQAAILAGFSVLYAVTLECMTVTALFRIPVKSRGQFGMDFEQGMLRRAQAHPSIRPLLQVAEKHNWSAKPLGVCCCSSHGLICRNETAQEWKNKQNWVADQPR